MPPEPDLPLIHQRAYDVKAYRQSATELRLRGTLRDQKPGGVYLPDDEPMTVHHMVVDLLISFPALQIVEVDVVLQTHPHEGCKEIEGHYQKLVGLSIARGFSKHVRDLFGGPRGCTHVGALLQAMAPVAIQSTWSMRVGNQGAVAVAIDRSQGEDGLRESLRFNLNTCHIWAEDGEMVGRVRAGEEIPPPLWAVERLERMGLQPEDWSRIRRGEEPAPAGAPVAAPGGDPGAPGRG